MKVLHIINSLNVGGAEKLLIDSVIFYKSLNVDVEILVLTTIDSSIFYDRIEDVKIHSLGINNIYNPLLIFKIIPYLHNYDLIHVHLFPSLYWVALSHLISFSRIKMIYTEHSTCNRRRNKIFLTYIEQRIYGIYNAIICISEGTNKALKKHLGEKQNHLITINNGVDLSSFNKAIPYPKKDFFEDDNAILLMQVSSFRKQKDQATIIKSLTYLDAKVKLILVGTGVLLSINQKLVNDLGLNDRVLFLGIRNDIPRLLKTTDIAILSSVWEGFGLVAVEGMAAGKPFIASDVEGLSDVVGGAGILFEQGNAKDLALQVSRLIQDNVYYNEVANKCLERSNEFHISYMVKRYIELYNKILYS